MRDKLKCRYCSSEKMFLADSKHFYKQATLKEAEENDSTGAVCYMCGRITMVIMERSEFQTKVDLTLKDAEVIKKYDEMPDLI